MTRASHDRWPQASFIGGLPDAERAALLAAGESHRFDDEEILLVQGEPGDFGYVLTGGLVKVIVEAESGVATTLALRSRGDLLGEFAALDRKPRLGRRIQRAACRDVALEGIACGCVVVGSEGGGLKEAIGRCGLTFPNGKADALALCLEKALTDQKIVADFLAEAPDHLARHRPSDIARRYSSVFSESVECFRRR